MNWSQSMKEPCKGWKMEFGVLIAPDAERYGPADALAPKQVAQLRGVELHTVNTKMQTGALPSFGFSNPLIYAADAVKGYSERKVKA